MSKKAPRRSRPTKPARSKASRASRPNRTRRTASSASSGSSSSTPTIADQIAELEDRLDDLQTAATLAQVKDSLEDVDSMIEQLPDALAQVRARGYFYKNFLESKITVLGQQWDELQPQIERELNSQSRAVRKAVESAESEIAQLRAATSSPARSKSLLATVAGSIGDAERKTEAAQSAIAGMYDTIGSNVNQTNQQVKHIAHMLDEIDESSVEWLPTERAVAAVKAKWWRDGKDKGPQGLLFLTDERLVFEQKEEVTTKKVLFVVTEKETLQEMLFQAVIPSVEEVKASHKGLGGHQDHLDITFQPGADYSTAHFHLDGQDSDDWQALVNRVKSGEIAREMIELSEEEGERMAQAETVLATAPTVCANCGATFTQAITKGLHEITCEYCGSVSRF